MGGRSQGSEARRGGQGSGQSQGERAESKGKMGGRGLDVQCQTCSVRRAVSDVQCQTCGVRRAVSAAWCQARGGGVRGGISDGVSAAAVSETWCQTRNISGVVLAAWCQTCQTRGVRDAVSDVRCRRRGVRHAGVRDTVSDAQYQRRNVRDAVSVARVSGTRWCQTLSVVSDAAVSDVSEVLGGGGIPAEGGYGDRGAHHRGVCVPSSAVGKPRPPHTMLEVISG
jgi:hypothetical protein